MEIHDLATIIGGNEMVDVSAHISAGVLLFRVSCGPQHIVFSDPRLRVDNGYVQTVELKLAIQVREGQNHPFPQLSQTRDQ